MSYILDALRRADAEREREKGAVPGLHAQPLGRTAMAGSATASGRPQVLWVALGLSLGLLGALAWWSFGRPAPLPAPPPPVVQVQVNPVPVTVPLPAAIPPVPAPAPAPAPAPVRETPTDRPVAAAVPPVLPGPTEKPADVAGPASATRPAAPAALPASTPPLPRAIALAQLAPELRNEMPAMTVGGSVYSPDPPSRFVIINGQVVREGEGAAAGVTVERIGPKSAVLRWREMRVEVPL